MIINHNKQPCKALISQGRLQTSAGSWGRRGRCARDGYGRVPPAHPPAGPGAAPVRPTEIPRGVTFSPPGAGEMLWGLPSAAPPAPVLRDGAHPALPPGAPRPPGLLSFGGSSRPPGTVRSATTAAPCRRAKPSRSSWARRVHTGGSLEGSGDAVLFPQGAGAGTGLRGQRGPDPGAAGAAARHSTESPGTASERAAATLTVQVSAPLAVGEQTC